MSKMKIDKEAIRELAELLEETGLGEIEWQDDTHRVRVVRSMAGAVQAPMYAMEQAQPHMAASSASAAAGTAEPAGEVAPESHPGAVRSPMVGTVYLQPEPGAASFVSVGDKVSEGQTLLIVEAMKTMNPIPAPHGGTVKRILVNNEEPVEYGQVLAIVE
jgi:acetyl-CoA carboxylase biotin carboxyl carrier protein